MQHLLWQGLEAINFWINNYPVELPNKVSKEVMIRSVIKEVMISSIRLILENTSFCFNYIYFLQSKGTAMGTKFASFYATPVLAGLRSH